MSYFCKAKETSTDVLDYLYHMAEQMVAAMTSPTVIKFGIQTGAIGAISQLWTSSQTMELIAYRYLCNNIVKFDVSEVDKSQPGTPLISLCKRDEIIKHKLYSHKSLTTTIRLYTTVSTKWANDFQVPTAILHPDYIVHDWEEEAMAVFRLNHDHRMQTQQ